MQKCPSFSRGGGPLAGRSRSILLSPFCNVLCARKHLQGGLLVLLCGHRLTLLFLLFRELRQKSQGRGSPGWSRRAGGGTLGTKRSASCLAVGSVCLGFETAHEAELCLSPTLQHVWSFPGWKEAKTSVRDSREPSAHLCKVTRRVIPAFVLMLS